MAVIADTDETAPLALRELSLALVLVDDSHPQSTPRRIENVLKCAADHGGDVLSFDASALILTFGISSAGSTEHAARSESFVTDLASRLAGRASAVYGTRTALVGSVGTNKRKTFTAIFEGYRDFLREVAATPLGQSKRI